MLITDVAVKNRTTVWVLIALIVFVGTFSYVTLPREAAPDVPIPFILISTSYRGVSPEDIETSVTIKIENELSGLRGVKEIRSTSMEGRSVVVVEFDPGIPIEDALQQVRDRVDIAKAELPRNEDIDDPVVQEINIAEFPIMILSVSGQVPPAVLKGIADELEEAIERVPGVLRVDISGEIEREIRLEIDQDRLTAYGLSLPELLALVPSENVNVSAGALETEGVKFNVRVPAEFAEPEDVDHLLLAVRDGRPIYLTDVAVVRDTFKDRRSYSRLDGAESVSLLIRKRIGANTVHISRAVNHILAEAEKAAPETVRFVMVEDQSHYIRMMVRDLENNILSGLILVIAVLVLFMGWRTSTIVALVIPLAMLISFAALQGMGYTLNMIVMFSLILALGMLVDNAIVIVENIYRHMQLGEARLQAAMRGAAEVAWPVATSTATTVAAFTPLLFWEGVTGDFMKYLPITVITVLGSSLFVALVINPVICSVFARAAQAEGRRESRFVAAYRRFLEAVLDTPLHRISALAFVGLLLAAMIVFYIKRGYGIEFFPDMDPSSAAVNIRSPQGTGLEESDRLARIVEERAKKYSDYIEHILVNTGGAGGAEMGMFGGGASGAHEADVNLLFYDYEERVRPSMEIIAALREDLADLPGVEIKVGWQGAGPPTGDPVTVRIIGRDFRQLARLSDEARAMMVDVPGLVNLRSDLEAARPEIVFQVDRRAAMLNGVNTATVGAFLRTGILGTQVGTFRDFNDEYDIVVRLPEPQRDNIDDILRLRIPNNQGQAVPLSALGQFAYRSGLGDIHRINQRRAVTLTADVEGRLGPDVLADVQERLAALELPDNYEIRYAGEKEEQDKAAAFLLRAFAVALLLIVMILVAQFNTLMVPLIILTTVALSLIGVFGGLLATQTPFVVIMTGIGVISLAGVVVNNAIVLLDYTRQLQARGMRLMEAAVQAGATRLRPVLLTATTTILSLVPMATGVSFDFRALEWTTRSESSQLWASMANAVIFGLGFATVLTLVVVPTLYVSLYRFAEWVGVKEEEALHRDGEEEGEWPWGERG